MIVSHYLELLHQYRRVFLAVVLGVFVGVTGIGAMKLALMPTYVATASITVLPTVAELYYTRRFVSDGDGGSDPASVMMQTHIENFYSRPVAELTLKRLEAEATERSAPPEADEESLLGGILSMLSTAYDFINTGTTAEPSPHDRAISAIQNAISIDWVQGSYILRISAKASVPESAKQLANSVSQAYAERSREVMGDAAAAVRRYLENEMKKPQAQLDPERLAELRRRMLESDLALAGLGQVRVINPATRPLRPSNELVKTMIGGGAAGVLLASLLIILLDIFSHKVRTSMDMVRVVGPGFLGRVPLRLAHASRHRSADWQAPHGSELAFASSVTAKIAATRRSPGPLWIHVVSVGHCDVARSGSFAIAVALASSDLSMDVILNDGDGDQRLSVKRRDGHLQVQRLTKDEPLGCGALVTAGHMLLLSDQLPLLRDIRADTIEAGGAAAPASEWDTTGVSPLPIVVLVVAAGQVYEDVLTAVAVERSRLFLLIP